MSWNNSSGLNQVVPKPATYKVNNFTAGSSMERMGKVQKENVVDFAQVSSTHGLYYTFEKNARGVSKLFWAITVVALLTLSLYFTITAFLQWRDDPVLTTVATTGHPISQLEFPAITICGQGTIRETVDMALVEQIKEYYRDSENVAINETWENELVLDMFEKNYTMAKFPGATVSPREIVRQMGSHDPDQLVEAEVVVAGDDYDPCAHLGYGDFGNGTATNGTNSTSTTTSGSGSNGTANGTSTGCSPSMPDFDANLKMCYGAPIGNSTVNGQQADAECSAVYGSRFLLTGNKTQLDGLREHFENGTLKPLVGTWIWTSVRRNVLSGDFVLSDGTLLQESEAVLEEALKIIEVNNTDMLCLVFKYVSKDAPFRVKQASCSEGKHYFFLLCQALSSATTLSECDAAKKKRRRKRSEDDGNKLDLLLNPDLKLEQQAAKELARRVYRESFTGLDMSAAYDSMFELLWYSQLPCFDVKKYTSEYADQRSMLKRCYWKGLGIDCKAIFTTFPTDRGMCCTFNMKAAEEIFVQSKYLENVAKLQERDKENAMGGPAGLPDWYVDGNEPKPQQGVRKGLTVMLDAHTDQIAASSVYDSFQGFMAVINSRESYPIVSQQNIRIRPGHDTLVAVTATDVLAKPDEIQGIDIEKRECLFPDEGEQAKMKFHRHYSYSSCILECQINYVVTEMEAKNKTACLPWYLPSTEFPMCDPWDAVEYRKILEQQTEDCSLCLPDCEGTSYGQTVTSVPFRLCDNRNLGISKMCDLSTSGVDPPIFGSQVYDEYQGKLPNYLEGTFTTSTRTLVNKDEEVFSVWADSHQTYDAYEKDIAMVHFYFDHPTVFQYRRAKRMTGIDFLSQVGGLLGLCLGLSLASVVELVYWLGVRLWFGCKMEPSSSRNNSGRSFIKPL